MRRPLTATLAFLAGCACMPMAPSDDAAADPGFTAVGTSAIDREPIEIAILLDTSSSMDGLIDQARSRLWAIVNDVARARRAGRSPDLRVAVYEYGNDGIDPALGWVRQVVPLTTDLDAISAALFALRTNGGSEHCGQAIARAVGDLAWRGGDHYRAVFIAGNEPFTQGPVPFTQACAAAVAKGVVVNTIHCGPRDQGLAGRWGEGARLGGGGAIDIDQGRVEVAIVAPQDERIAVLNDELNQTYVAYGVQRAANAARQVEQDANAASVGGSSFASRACSKAGGQYRNDDWDLVDACADPGFDLAAVPDDSLPEELRALDVAARRAHIAAKAAHRAAVQAEVLSLVSAREAFLLAARSRMGAVDDDDFGAAVRALLRRQLARTGYLIE